MTNDQFPMTKEFPMSNDQCGRCRSLVIGIWSFIDHWSLVIGHLLTPRFSGVNRSDRAKKSFQRFRAPLVIGIWSFIGYWSLVIGHLLTPCFSGVNRSDRAKKSLQRFRAPLVIGIWSFIGHWSLVIGHLLLAA